MYTGLLSQQGFLKKIHQGEAVCLLVFPKRYKNMPYFVPIVSAVIRSLMHHEQAAYFGENVFAIRGCTQERQQVAQLLEGLSELGVFINEKEMVLERIDTTQLEAVEELLTQAYQVQILSEGVSDREAYAGHFQDLRKEMKYSPQENWSIERAAERIGLSSSHFQRLYRRFFDVSFTEDLIGFRMERARFLLKNTALSIREIADACGYATPAHFMRQFKAREHVSAGAYRKKSESAS